MNLDVYLRYTENRISYHKKILNMFLNFINIINFDKNKNNDKCCVCLDSLCDIKLPCNHAYHYKCALKWFKTKNCIQCPMCRSDYTYLLFKDSYNL